MRAHCPKCGGFVKMYATSDEHPEGLMWRCNKCGWWDFILNLGGRLAAMSDVA